MPQVFQNMNPDMMEGILGKNTNKAGAVAFRPTNGTTQPITPTTETQSASTPSSERQYGRREKNITGESKPVEKGEQIASGPVGQQGYSSLPIRENPTPANNNSSNSSGSSSGSAPSGGGYYPASAGTPSAPAATSTTASVQAGNNAAPIQAAELGDPTNHLLKEYNSMDDYERRQADATKENRDLLIDLSNAQIDEQVKAQIAGLTNQLDTAQRQYAQIRAKLEQAKATEADNIRLANAANGDRGGVGQAQYSAQMQQRDQALYEIDLEQINLEQELNQAILEAEATGNYQKLANTIELTSAAYEQLYNLADQVMQTKTSDAARLDSYYEGIREFDADYNLQIQQIQQNAVLNKVNAGITVTPEDMEQFGLRGADAQTAADNLNASQGVERQILSEQLKSLQNSNSARTSSGGGGYYYGGGGGGASYDEEGDGGPDSYWSREVPYSVAAQFESTLMNGEGVPVTRADGSTYNIWLSSDGTNLNVEPAAGDSIYGGEYVYNGSQFVPRSSYNSNNNGSSLAEAPNNSDNIKAAVRQSTGINLSGDTEAQVRASAARELERNQNLLMQRYLEVYNKYGGRYNPDFNIEVVIGDNDPYWTYMNAINTLKNYV